MSRQPSPAVKALTHLGLLLAVAVAVYPVLWVLKMAFSESQAFGLSASLRTVNSWLPDSTNRVSGIPGVIQLRTRRHHLESPLGTRSLSLSQQGEPETLSISG